LSIATKIQVRWSGLLFGIMMVLFVAMLHIPRALASPSDRIPWTIVYPRNVIRRRSLASCCKRDAQPRRKASSSPWAAY